ncbi:MAG: formate dehydrogenase subunit alpha [Spirochaetia bacterium]|nr:formate dehydrogenase subunit alpha [Spirochaetia bacterium]
MKQITCYIDDKAVTVAEGTTLLNAARKAGIDIPNLCYDPRCAPIGACRLCLVEIEGQRGMQTSCTRIVEPDMRVATDTPKLNSQRKRTLELILSEHRFECGTCDTDGECRLQDYAYDFKVQENRIPHIESRVKTRNYTSGEKALIYDPTKCIRCGRCVAICAEVQGIETLTLRNRSGQVLVTTGFDVPLKESTCETCSQCISTCPTSALYERSAKFAGKLKDMNRVRTTCGYCGVGCQIDLNVHKKTGKIVRVTSEVGVVPNDGNLCVKGRFGMDFVGDSRRLTKPLIRTGERGDGAYREAEWDEALDLVASRLSKIKKEAGPDAIAGFSSARTTNEDNFVMQKFVRAAVGTNNVDHCARLCHSSTVAGLAKAFGSGAMTNSIAELSDTPLIFIIGSNTTECHPIIGINIRQAVQSGKSKLIVADPRRISIARSADIHMQQRSGSDVALINAMMHVILKEDLADRDFIASRTEGFEDLLPEIEGATPELAEKITSVPAETIRKAARMYATAESAAIIYSMGITQHACGTDNVLVLANLAMMTGNVGRRNAGVNPLRGQNNVQGACDMGALPNVYNGYQKVDDPKVQKKFETAWNTKLSNKPGLTVVEIMNGLESGKVRGLYVMGENPALSDPDTNHVLESLKKADFLVVQDIFMTETAELADVVLPAYSFAEKEGTFTNTERRVQRLRKAVTPPGEALEDWEIICRISLRMGYEMAYGNTEAIMKEIQSLTPSYGGITYKRIDKVGLQWPCPTEDHPGTPWLHEGTFARGLGKFHTAAYIPPREQADTAYPLVLTTGRQLEHWHTGTMTRKSVVLDDRVPHGVLELNPEDATRLGVADGEPVKVSSRRGEVTVPARVGDKTAPGTVFLVFHFKEHPANALTIAALDPVAKIPEFKACAVKVEKSS